MKLLLYCTKGKEILWWNKKFDKGYQFFMDGRYNRLLDECPDFLLNGKIVAECDFEVEEIYPFYKDFEYEDRFYEIPNKLDFDNLLKESCLNACQMSKYLGDKSGYAIHIKNLHIFDEPEPLEYYEYGSKYVKIGTRYHRDGTKEIYPLFDSIKKAPQNMAEVIKYPVGKVGKFILISIRPEWLCKILNGEKTIEVRKKVLKEMMK